MADLMKALWQTPCGALSFAAECDPCADPLVVSVRIYRTALPTQFDIIVVGFGAPAEFSIRFPGAYYAYGIVRLDWVASSGCTGVICVTVDVHYGAENGSELTAQGTLLRFNGIEPQICPAPICQPPCVLPPCESDPCIEPCEPACVEPICGDIDITGTAPAMPGQPPQDAAEGSALFPYLYLRKWPLVSALQMALRFISYTPLESSPPQQSFYGSLASSADRYEMQQLSLDFIEGAPPYQGQFVTEADLRTGYFAILAELARILRSFDCEVAGLLDWIGCRVAPAVLRSDAYATDVERIWDSYFALVIAPWAAPSLLPQMSMLLVAVHLLDYLAAPPAGAPPLNRTMLRELARATIILPTAVFPMPPAELSPPLASPPCSLSPPAGEKGWIEPYAIGDLQLVRQRLLRYACGEIAAIENLMRGERRETSRRRARRQVDVGMTDVRDLDELDNTASDTRDDLASEAVKTIADKTVQKTYTNLSTSYGPPTIATVDGGPVTTAISRGPNAEDATRFAHEVLNKTVSRISRSVGNLRGSSVMNESAETVTSTLDNSGGTCNQVTVYRWINKVYEAFVVNYGRRLMIEFMLVAPAAPYLRDAALDERLAFCLPRPPALEGIHSFEDIRRDNYARLAAQYRVSDIAPPPPEMRYVSAVLGGGEARLVALPPGYRARFATVNAIVAASLAPPTVMVAGKAVASPYGAVAMPSGCGGNVAIAVGGDTSIASPPSDSAAQTSAVQVTVTVTCVPCDDTMDEWRIKTYNAVMAGYRNMCEARLALDRHERPALAARRIVARELRRDCLCLIEERSAALTGYPDPVLAGLPGGRLPGPGRMQFIEEMFEWNEMSYRFYRQAAACQPCLIESDGEAAEISGFLDADLARVLVPARPEYSLALLYLLSSGLLWEGGNATTPVFQPDVPLVNELKDMACEGVQPCRRVGAGWEIVVPTAMQIIDGVTMEGLL